MILISNLSLSFGDRILFDDISISIKPRDKIGLVGRNGAGKTTLFKVIGGEMTADSGRIQIPNGKTLGYLEQDITLNAEISVLEETLTVFEEVHKVEAKITELEEEIAIREDYESNAYHQLLTELSDYSNRLSVLGSASMESVAAKILHGLGFTHKDFSRPIKEFSGGWQMRIVLAKLLLSKPDYILLDEPTNHLDIESIIWLEKFLIDYPGAVLLISHDKQFLDKVTKITIEIEQGKIHNYKANYSQYLHLRIERQEKLLAAYKNQQRVISEKERTISRFMAKATKTKLAQSMQKQLDKMDRIELDEFDSRTMKLHFPEAERAGQIVLDIQYLSKSYGALEVLKDISLKMDRGDRLAFVGQNGQGKTTLARIIVDQLSYSAGQMKLGHNVKIGYYAQNQSSELDPGLTVLETMDQHSSAEMRPKLRSILGAFLFSGEDVDKKVIVLSGGEKARLAIAIMLLRPFNFLVMDEPTNHLDMHSKEVLKRALQDYKGSVIVVSHDRDFLAGLTNRTIEFRNKKLFDYPGDINYFLQKRVLDDMRAVEMREKQALPEKTVQGVNTADKLAYEDRRKLQKSIRKSEKSIEKLEAEIKSIEEQMHRNDFYSSAESAGVLKHYSSLKARLSEAYEVWEEKQGNLDIFGY